MAQIFYSKWQSSVLADAGTYVSKEYRRFQTSLVREIPSMRQLSGQKLYLRPKDTTLPLVLSNVTVKFVYLNHSADVRMDDGIKIELDSFMIRTARYAKDYTGGTNQYCDMLQLQSMIDKLLS